MQNMKTDNEGKETVNNIKLNKSLTDTPVNPTAPLQTTATNSIGQDSKNHALINWLGCLVFGFIPPLILMLTQKDDAYVQSQSKEALNWSITFFVAYIGLWIVAMIIGFVLGMIFAPLAVIPMFLLIIFAFSHPIFCIMGAVKCSSGQNYRVPFNWRLIK